VPFASSGWHTKKPLKLYVQAQREAENIVHHMPLLCLQLTGPRVQDIIPWGNFPKLELNCLVPECGHALTMPLQSQDLIISGDERLRRAAEADGGGGRFEPLETKVGCYCFNQNCFGDESRIGCWWCVELAMEKRDVPDEVEPGVCHFECNICRCACQAMFDESKRCQISNGIKKKMELKPVELHQSKSKGGCLLFFDFIKNSLNNHSVQEFQQVNFHSKMELIQDISMLAASNILNDVQLQSNPHIMRGLQGIIPGHQMNIEMTDAHGRKVRMSIVLARNKLERISCSDKL
jgi:hypothetical protein